ncbi:glycosyl transferase family 2 [Pluralibacter gergoviae]|uniref:glycosyltransferase n=1 Tax=Pluralibacter gergoviae TaxID=61647 RepID=UPI000650E3E2|nr:glycosyltransferase [Pluralibacter gergoviae]KMK18079.1 glycosyl transferase family 2 [Pluralibacter gergoviae]
MQGNIKYPKVTVYISTYNRLEKLKRAISSVICQDYPEWELLICDDASTDGTKDFCVELEKKYNNIKYYRNESNLGACATRNLGINNAKGLYITGLDDDDEFTKNRLSYFVEQWNDRYSFLCCNFLNDYCGSRQKHYKQKNKSIEYNYYDLLYENEASNQIFTLTSRLVYINGFNTKVKRLQDWDTWLRLAYQYGKFIRLPEITYIMHHDHLPNESRVSQNINISDALIQLASRNKDIYKMDGVRYMHYLVTLMNKKAKLSESLYWAFVRKNIKFIIKYFMQ